MCDSAPFIEPQPHQLRNIRSRWGQDSGLSDLRKNCYHCARTDAGLPIVKSFFIEVRKDNNERKKGCGG